jgi:hypothetical protein
VLVNGYDGESEMTTVHMVISFVGAAAAVLDVNADEWAIEEDDDA